MKRPREILLDRHRAVETKLDTIRQQVLTGLTARRMDAPATASRITDFLFSLRWHLSGLAALWLVIAGLRLLADAGAASEPEQVRQAAPPRQLLLALRENRRHLAELLGVSPTTIATTRPGQRPSSALEPNPSPAWRQHRGQIQSSSNWIEYV